MGRIAPQDNELLYNRIAPLYAQQGGDVYAVLDNPLLNLLNVKYILTEHFIPNPHWQEVYRDEAVGVYENRDVTPRSSRRRRVLSRRLSSPSRHEPAPWSFWRRRPPTRTPWSLQAPRLPRRASAATPPTTSSST